MREARDATLAVPKLLLPSIQVNIRGGRFPAADANGVRFLRIPVKIKDGIEKGVYVQLFSGKGPTCRSRMITPPPISTINDKPIIAKRSEEHPSELQSLMRIPYAVSCFKKKTHTHNTT